MALSNLLKCWLCDNVNLNLVWISRVLGARRQCMTVFPKKKLNKASVKRLIFYKLGTSLQLKWEKLLVKDVQNRERTAPAKPLVAIGELQFDYVSSKNDRSNKKNLFRPLISQQQLQLFISYSNFLRIAIAKICTCNSPSYILHQIFVRTVDFFKALLGSCPFFKLLCHFI